MTTAQSPELQAKLTLYRQKAMANTLTKEEMREAVLLMRQDRMAASQAAKSTKAKTPARSADAMLDELGL